MKKYFFVLALLAGSCTEPIDLHSDGMAPLLAITCVLTDTTVLEFGHFVVSENNVVIQKTTPYFGDLFTEYVLSAKVRLNSELLTLTGQGYYTPKDFQAEPGKEYTLEVLYDLDGDGVEEVFRATTTMPQRCHLDSITLHPLPFGGDYFANLRVHFMGVPGENYYGAKLNNLNDTRMFSTRILRYTLFQYDFFSNEEEYKRLSPDWYIQHEMSYDNEEKYYIYAGDTLSVTLESLSKEYHHFLEVAKIEASQRNPFFSPPRANLPTNFSGGAIGIFGAYTASSAKVLIPEDTQGLPKRP